MKLSEAIRIGAAMSLPAKITAIKRDDKGRLHACALGAAHLGAGGDPDEENVYLAVATLWPELNKPAVAGEDDLESSIWRRNDGRGWSRERIADWLEGLGY